jgi:hypothetical protein
VERNFYESSRRPDEGFSWSLYVFGNERFIELLLPENEMLTFLGISTYVLVVELGYKLEACLIICFGLTLGLDSMVFTIGIGSKRGILIG